MWEDTKITKHACRMTEEERHVADKYVRLRRWISRDDGDETAYASDWAPVLVVDKQWFVIEDRYPAAPTKQLRERDAIWLADQLAKVLTGIIGTF